MKKMRKMFMSSEELASEETKLAQEQTTAAKDQIDRFMRMAEHELAQTQMALRDAYVRKDEATIRRLIVECERHTIRIRDLEKKRSTMTRDANMLNDSMQNIGFVKLKRTILKADRLNMEATGMTTEDIKGVISDSDNMAERTRDISEMLGEDDTEERTEVDTEFDEDMWEERFLRAANMGQQQSTLSDRVEQRLNGTHDEPPILRSPPTSYPSAQTTQDRASVHARV